MKKIKTIIGSVFILIGILLVSIPLYFEWQQKKEERAIEEALSFISNNADIDSSKMNTSLDEEQLKNILRLEIPSIDLKQYVLDETTEKNLNIALTQIKKNQTPGSGNFTIAGHLGYREGRFFNNLPRVQKGEKVYLHSDSQTFVYGVREIRTIQPTEVEILENHDEKQEITMITCTPNGKERVVVIGDLEEISPKK